MNRPFRLAILDDYQRDAACRAAWSASASRIEAVFFHERFADRDALVEALAEMDGIVAMRERTAFPREVLETLPRLKLLVTTGMANAAIDLGAATDLGVTVCGTASMSAPVVELTWGLILGLVRGVVRDAIDVREGGWQTMVGEDLAGRRLGVLGPGRIGAGVARVGLAFDMDVAAWSPHLTIERARELGVTKAERLEDLMERSDIVSVHLRLTPQSRGLIGREDLALMPTGSFLVNTARSAIVDERALLEAVERGHLKGAALDVFDHEPLPVDSSLRTHPGILSTSHIGYVSAANYSRFYGEALEDVAAFLGGAPVRVLNGG